MVIQFAYNFIDSIESWRTMQIKLESIKKNRKGLDIEIKPNKINIFKNQYSFVKKLVISAFLFIYPLQKYISLAL